LLIIISRQGLSRLGKKPSMALIEPVQFCRATSVLREDYRVQSFILQQIP